MRRRSPRRLSLALALALVAFLAADQLVQHTVLADGRLRGVPVAPYDPPIFAPYQREQLEHLRRIAAGDPGAAESIFDPDLGWCPRPGPSEPPYEYDAHGARATATEFPREPVPGVRRVVVLGDSFVRGDEVAGDEAWAALLNDRREDCAVLNLGMGGYGTDQAVLRLERDALPLAPDEVWLSWMPAGSLRVVTHYPPLLRHWSGTVAFKPRFLVDAAGTLELVPSPVQAFADFDRLFSDQRALLDAIGRTDHWLARAPLAYAPRGSSWTHWLAGTRVLLTWHERWEREPGPWVRDPESEVHRLHMALFRRAADESRAAGARFRLLVLPSWVDLESAVTGAPFWQGLVDELRSEGREVLDATEALIAADAMTDPEFWMPGGHYGPHANRVVAELLAREWLEP